MLGQHVCKDMVQGEWALSRRDQNRLMHALYGPSGVVVLPDGSRLFDGTDRGDMEEGLPQGSPESSMAFCVLIQEAVTELHDAHENAKAEGNDRHPFQPGG